MAAAALPILAAVGRFAAPWIAERIMRFSRVPREDIEHYVAMLSEPGRRHVSEQYYRRALFEDLPSSFRENRPRPPVPMTFVGGSTDPVVRYAKGIELVPGASHFLPDNDPDLVAERALAFFASA